MRIFERQDGDIKEHNISGSLDTESAKPVLMLLPGVIPTPDVFTSYGEMEEKAPTFFKLVDGARQIAHLWGGDTWGIFVFSEGLHDIIVPRMLDLASTLYEGQQSVANAEDVRIFTISTHSVEDNTKMMHAVMENPENTVSDQMSDLASFLFQEAVFDGETPRTFDDVADRLNKVTLLSVSLGNTQAIELETALYRKLDHAEFEPQQQHALAAMVKMVGAGCFMKCINGKATQQAKEGVLQRPGFAKHIFEATEDIYTEMFGQRDAFVPMQGTIQKTVCLSEINFRHTLFTTPSHRHYQFKCDPEPQTIEDYTYHRPEGTILPDVRYGDEHSHNIVPHMVSHAVRSSVHRMEYTP